MKNSQIHNLTHKTIPKVIRLQVEKALHFYPELKEVPITFKFKKKIRKSTMQAQPRYSSFFKKRKNREYVILISKKFHIEDDTYNILDVADKIMIGWIGHELGHIMDYKRRSAVGMLIFGFKYLFFHKHIQTVERTADTFAVKHGMGEYILATKNFILNHSNISPTYKSRIKRLYLSPEEIMAMVNTFHKKNLKAQVEKELREKT